MKHWSGKSLLAIMLLALAACGHTGIAKPSDIYLHCAAEPDVPGDPVSGIVTDAQDAQYKRDLRAAGQDCRSKLGYVRDWFSKLPD